MYPPTFGMASPLCTDHAVLLLDRDRLRLTDHVVDGTQWKCLTQLPLLDLSNHSGSATRWGAGSR